MGFLTRLVAGLVAASTLGAGLAGTAGAVDTTGATGNAKGVVKLASDDTSGLPDHLVNGDFEYPGANVLSKNRYDEKDCNWWGVSRKDKMVYDPSHETQWVSLPSTFDSDRFAWDSTEVAGTQNGSSQWHTNEVELQRDSRTGNMYGELCAYQANTSIRQYIRTTPGVLYKVRLKHASLSRDYLDKMQVLIGSDGNEQPVSMTRVESQNGLDATGESTASTTVSTHASNEMEIKDGQGTPYSSRNHNGQWATYEGVYVATSDVTSFTFKSVDAKAYNLGNLLDDIVFDKAYRLSYDKNSTAASGQVPSNEHGRENTVQPAKAKTTGTVKTVADENVRYGSLANGDFSYPSFSDIQKNEQEGYADLRTFLKSDDGTLWYNMSATDLSKYGKIGQIPGFDSSRFAWSSTENGSRVELQQDRNTKNTYAEIVAQQDNTSIYQNVSTGNGGVLYKIRLKHASRQSSHVDRMQVLVGSDMDHATPVEMTRVTSNGHGDKVGGKSTIITTKVSNTDPRDHGAQWETYEGYYQVPEGQKNTVFMFKSLEGFKEDETLPGNNIGNLVDDIEFSRSYKLTYDANSSDASGQVPSDTAANTVKQAKSKTNGSVRLAADDDVAEYAANGLPKQIANGGFDYPSVPSWTALPESGSNKYNKGKLFATINPGTGKYGSGCAMSTTGRAIPNWNRLNFAWNSTQEDTHYSGGMGCEAGNVELNYDSVHHNQFAELTADQQGTAIYQDVKVTPGTMMKWSLKHSSATSAYVDKMQVLIGEPYKETAQEATRITSENGNKVGEKMTTISTPTTSDRADNKKWDTYSGTYLVPDEVTTVRFTFKSIASAEWYSGNDLDDIKFSRSYQLSYDKNAGDATGSVPSNQRGKENTVQPAKARAMGTVKTVADDDSSKSLTVNPGFDVPDYSKLDDGGLHWMYVSPAEGEAWSYYDYINPAQPKHQVAGLSQATFGWQELTGGDYKTTLFELHREKDGNVCADVHGSRTIGQTIDTQAGVAYTVSIRHSGRSKGNAGSVQVLVGPDKNHLRPLEMSRMNVSRTGAKYGDRTGKVGTVITTHSDSVDSTEGNHLAWDHSDDWETYSGTYVATGGKTVFAYRGVDKNGNAVSGTDSAADSVIDDLSFKLAYPLVYDKNAGDATGSVPSSQYGKENTVQPAKAKTNGTVKTVVDTSDGLPTELVNGDFEYPGADVLSQNLRDKKRNWWGVSRKDKMVYESDNPTKWVSLPSTFDSDRFAWDSSEAGKTSGVQEGSSQWHTNEVELQRDSRTGNMYAELSPYQAQSSIRQYIRTTPGALYKVRLKHASLSSEYLDKMQVLIGTDGNEQPVRMTRVESQNGLDAIGESTASTTISTHASNKAEISWGSGLGYHSSRNYDGQWATYEGVYVATSDVTVFTFKSVDSPSFNTGNLLDDVAFTKAYKLTYDKNAADASGQVPSNTTPDTTQTASSKSTGKVSDLVQRTTTHEDGSVTVKTIDTSTDVVSGCQVYYPAGQRITLATMAKDDDCWDSSMLSRPGHTQLGWNQDRNATQAQAQVTMVEGGMTVYAVWVGNPVLTYDTNKPNTWNGQMPSTPASVSVAYNTAAADGSGWQSGDTSKIRGYRFLGWYAGPQDDSGLYDWNTLLTGNVTVYAHWQRLQANVVYDANGGTGSHGTTTGWQYSDVTVPSDTSKSFKRAGYVFLGWDTQADGNGTAYKDGSQVPLQDKDITLYAQWQPVFEQFTPTGGVSLPLLVAGGVALLVMGIGSTVMLTRRMRGEQ